MRSRSLRNKFSGIFYCGLLFSWFFLSSALAGDIVIFGDSQNNELIRREVVQAVLALKPSVVFSAGDNVDDGRDPKQWKLFYDINEPLLERSEFFTALGNHEVESSLCFLNYSCLLNRKPWYSVEREGIHFIVLDSNVDLRPGSEQYKWLVSDLDSVKEEVKFRIAIFHQPIFDVGFHLPDGKRLKPILMPLFKKYGICAVFSGHDHNYQRFEYEGIYFIVTGGAGGNLYNQSRTSPYLKKFVKTHHFCLLTPGPDSIKVRVIGLDGQTIDEFTIVDQQKFLMRKVRPDPMMTKSGLSNV